MPFFKEFGVGLERHIGHEFYEETSAKSEVVSILMYYSLNCELWSYYFIYRLHLGSFSKVK